ncbi:solute carrier family 25 member 40-like [Anneissia japonica]|uniref:solute carrier family 25 member 40-like n=1 Tax=Anneissia japonica TaxID=1529436 RepID=UPI00142562CF|nr:solute carrier family 25 member 40-like [Anneissia japonica]
MPSESNNPRPSSGTVGFTDENRGCGQDMVASAPAVDVRPPRNQTRLKPWQQMVSSCTGAILTSLTMTPMDVVKIRLQAQQKPMVNGQCFLYCNGLMDHLCTCINGNTGVRPWYKLPGHYSGTMDAFIGIARNEGITALWSGLPPTLLMAVPQTVMYYTAYDQLKGMMGFQDADNQSLLIPMVAGGIARVGVVSLISPLELIRTKMQSRVLGYHELKDCIKTAIKEEGVSSLWRGLPPTLLRDVPFSMILWVAYEYFRTKLCHLYHIPEPTFVVSFTAGAISGTIAGVLTLPFDVVKTHRQIEMGEIETKRSSAAQLTTTKDIVRRIYMERGMPGLFAGITPRILKVMPACAIMLGSYEFGKSFFRKYNSERTKKSE